MASRKKLRSGSNFSVWIALVIFTIALIMWGFLRFSPTASTYTVFEGESTETINAKGIAVFEEELMSSKTSGIPVINYPDGERVVAKTHVASLYNEDIDDGKSVQISEINERINYLQTNIKNLKDDGKGEKSFSEALIGKMKQVSYYGISGNFESIQRENSEIKNIISTSNSGDLSLQLEELKSLRDEFESTIAGDKEDYISKKAGVIYSTLDGYETTITPTTTKDADPKAFETLWNSKPVDYEKHEGDFIYGRIVNNFEITVLSLVATKDATDITEGQTIYLKLKGRDSSSLPATVKKITNTGRNTLIVLNVTADPQNFIAERKFEFQFVKRIYKGLKIPATALENSGNNGTVLVIKDSVVTRKKVEILHSEGDYVIVKEDNAASDNLLLYDLVITKSKNLSEGQIITDYK